MNTRIRGRNRWALAGLAISVMACGGEYTPDIDTEPQEIIGGWTAIPHSYPWQARITFNGGHWCGGALLDPRWVVTAAHCISGVPTSQLRVVMGDHNINVTESGQQTRTISNAIVHPSFSFSTARNDVALLQVSSAFTIDATKQTIGLPTSNVTGFALASGWGRTNRNSSAGSSTLQVTWMAPRNNTDCTNNLPNWTLNGTQLCAGFLNGSNGTCQGDSGGPLFLPVRSGSATLIGLTSGGNPNCDSFGVFTRVWSFRNWILDNMGGGSSTPNVTMTWSGNLVPTGEIRITCANTGQTQSGSTGTRGTNLALECRNSNITASCTTNGYSRREIDGFTRRVNGSTTFLSHGTTNASNTFFVGTGDTVHYNCELTD